MAQEHFQLEHFAHLARLDLDPADKESLQQEMDSILELVGQLGELDLDEVATMDHVANLVNAYREDGPSKSLPREVVLETFPENEDNQNRVPQMIAGED